MVSVPIPTPPPIAVKPTELACLRRAEGHKDGSALTHILIVSLCVGRDSCRTAPPIPRILWRAWWSTPLRLRSASRCTNGVCLFILYQYCLRLHLARCSGQDVLPPVLVVVCRDGRPQSGGGVHWRKVIHTLSIFSVCPHHVLCPPDMHRAMPWGDTITPFCEGE